MASPLDLPKQLHPTYYCNQANSSLVKWKGFLKCSCLSSGINIREHWKRLKCSQNRFDRYSYFNFFLSPLQGQKRRSQNHCMGEPAEGKSWGSREETRGCYFLKYFSIHNWSNCKEIFKSMINLDTIQIKRFPAIWF